MCFMDILFTVSNTVKLFLFYHIVNSISTVPPVVNSKGKKNRLAFYWNAFECEHDMTVFFLLFKIVYIVNLLYFRFF